MFSNSLVSGWCRTLGPGFSYGPNSNKTDLRLSYVEQKTPETKRVEALLFRIARNPHCHRLLAPISDASEEAAGQQPELFPGDQESEKYLEEIQTTFKLSSPQLKRVRLAALRDDWKPPVKLHKQPKQPAPAPLPRPPSPEEEAEMLRRIKEEAAAFRCKVNECNSKKPTLK